MGTLQSELDRALLGLENRDIIRKLGDTWEINPDQEAVLQFYANSISQFLPKIAAVAK